MGFKFDYVKIKAGWYYAGSIFGVIYGGTYLFPLFYKTFCEKTGFSASEMKKEKYDYAQMHDVKKIHRKFDVHFKAICEPDLAWSFFPLQESVQVNAGETVLAFYRAYNDSDDARIGISAYVTAPDEASQYFHKIQCFCFDEQMLNPKEEIDLPLFFYLDPKICNDPLLVDTKEITLMYTFYKAQDQTLAQLLSEHPNSPHNLKHPSPLQVDIGYYDGEEDK
jgi:cytochrome c oxidase assembly protein subunit 11